mgnify:CR=1 FL=1
MNTSEIINHIATLKDIPKQDVKTVIDEYHAVISDGLIGGNRYTIAGFGSFNIKVRAAKKGRNPQTGEAVDIPEHKTVTFKPSPNFIKHRLNGHFHEEK